MRIVLSRKGFDAAFGGCASPILDGRLVSLPIPEPRSPIAFGDLRAGTDTLGQLVADLGGLAASTRAHLDPDLRRGSLPRERGWRPLFGQTGAAQSHLARRGVGVGDLFLFFGWFREVERRAGRFRYVPRAPDLHVLFGWLRVGETWSGEQLEAAKAPSWARAHPHIGRDYGPANTVYVAARRADGTGDGGAFPRVSEGLILTAPGACRGLWRLPGWFHPTIGRAALGYHGQPWRWQRSEGHVLLRTVGRGQEFVLDADHYPEAREWSARTIAASSAG